MEDLQKAPDEAQPSLLDSQAQQGATEPAPVAPDGETEHVVADGETLMSIAMHYYSNSTARQAIILANDLESLPTLRVGQTLVIPAL
jgi:nucleoid-associated protein YgaU